MIQRTQRKQQRTIEGRSGWKTGKKQNVFSSHLPPTKCSGVVNNPLQGVPRMVSPAFCGLFCVCVGFPDINKYLPSLLRCWFPSRAKVSLLCSGFQELRDHRVCFLQKVRGLLQNHEPACWGKATSPWGANSNMLSEDPSPVPHHLHGFIWKRRLLGVINFSVFQVPSTH